VTKKPLFIMTHLGSGYEKLSLALEEQEIFHVFQTGNSYKHPTDVSNLVSLPHFHDNSSAIWVDVIFHNKDFAMKQLCPYYNFIFWSCSFEDCLEELVEKHNYKEEQAKNYWSYRMEGIKQYQKRTKGLWNPSLEGEFMFSSIFR
jgi:hypothetical protein